MDYKGQRKGNYGNQQRRRATKRAYSKRSKKETSWRADLHKGLVKTEKTEEEISPVPEQIEEKGKTTPKLIFKNQAGTVELERSNEKTTTTKLPKDVDVV